MADLVNSSSETLGFAEARGSDVSQALAEALGWLPFYPATPYHGAGDFGAYNAPVADGEASDFITYRGPLGYSRFRNFVPGEYQFRRAYIDFVFTPVDDADAQLTLSAATIYADVPDKVESGSGTITVAATGLVVTFASAFATPPNVTVNGIGSTAVIAVLTAAPTTGGFTVKLFNTSGVAVTGTVLWTAIGY